MFCKSGAGNEPITDASDSLRVTDTTEAHTITTIVTTHTLHNTELLK